MKRFLAFAGLLLLTATLLPTRSQAQTTETHRPNSLWGGLGFFEIGITRLNTAGALGKLPTDAHPVLPENGLFTGGAGYFVFSNFVIGGQGGGLALPERTGPRYRTRLAGGGGQLQLGYAARLGKVVLLPLAGIGGQGYTARLQDRPAQPGTFAEAVGGPKPEITLTIGSATGSLGLLAVRPWHGLAMGLRVQYLAALQSTGWRYDDRDLAGSPRWRGRQLTATLLLGGGGLGSLKD